MKKILVVTLGIGFIFLFNCLRDGGWSSRSVRIADIIVSSCFLLWIFKSELKRFLIRVLFWLKKGKKQKSTVWWDGLNERHCSIERGGETVAIRYSDGSVKFYPGATLWDKIRIHFL